MPGDKPSPGNLAGRTVTITGTDQDGNPVTETYTFSARAAAAGTRAEMLAVMIEECLKVPVTLFEVVSGGPTAEGER